MLRRPKKLLMRHGAGPTDASLQRIYTHGKQPESDDGSFSFLLLKQIEDLRLSGIFLDDGDFHRSRAKKGIPFRCLKNQTLIRPLSCDIPGGEYGLQVAQVAS